MKPIANLTIKRKWLDMIVSGEKREEYRVPNTRGSQYWCYRLAQWQTSIVFRAGYNMDSPAAVVEVTEIVPPLGDCSGVFALEGISEPEHPEWGEFCLPHWTIKLGKVLKSGTYRECKEFLKGVEK